MFRPWQDPDASLAHGAKGLDVAHAVVSVAWGSANDRPSSWPRQAETTPLFHHFGTNFLATVSRIISIDTPDRQPQNHVLLRSARNPRIRAASNPHGRTLFSLSLTPRSCAKDRAIEQDARSRTNALPWAMTIVLALTGAVRHAVRLYHEPVANLGQPSRD
jgi:hypothetical protein